MKNNMNKSIVKIFSSLIAAILFIVGIFSFNTFAQENTYSMDQVAVHNNTQDCWVIYDDGVYDLTSYLRSHDRYLQIDSWCGKDITLDFETKAGTQRDHKTSSYYLLESYKIGQINTDVTDEIGIKSDTNIASSIETDIDTQITSETKRNTDTEINNDKLQSNIASNQNNIIIDESSKVEEAIGESAKQSNPYNVVIPLLATFFLYFISKLISQKSNFGKKYLPAYRFNFIWNSLLLISLIPSALFGIYMVLRYSFPVLYDIHFDFMYWHVEGSIVMSTIALLHFTDRIKIFVSQGKNRK